ncbi:MAG: MBL fold metallo-hydrolase [Bdellovibrionales bacterium]|nr:MBL fold metallo-hydrolase [Bdellovibrionales bacterium]
MKIIFFVFAVLALNSCISAPGYIGNNSDHYDGTYFKNRTKMANNSRWDIFKYVVSTPFKNEKWPEWIEEAYNELPKNIDPEHLNVTFINHATVLIRHQGQAILTDPVFAKRASPFSWLGPKRVRNPGIKKEDLPELNVILISHNHYDHLDIESLKWLYKNKGEPLILVGLGVGELLKENDIHNFIEMDWNDKFEESGTSYYFLECRHRSGRGLSDQMKTLWGSFAILIGKYKIYFAGDSGYDLHFKEAGEKFNGFDLSLLPIGAYEPRWFMKDPHVNPEEAVQAHLDLKSKLSMGIHFGTFQLTYEKIDDPLKDLNIALSKRGLSDKDFIAPTFGQNLEIPF